MPVPTKDLSKHIGLDISDIKGAQPTSVKKTKGRKGHNFFPDQEEVNEYYNREIIGQRPLLRSRQLEAAEERNEPVPKPSLLPDIKSPRRQINNPPSPFRQGVVDLRKYGYNPSYKEQPDSSFEKQRRNLKPTESFYRHPNPVTDPIAEE